MDKTKELEAICKKYELPVFESARDNFIMILEAAEPTREEKWHALDIYDDWLLALYKED